MGLQRRRAGPHAKPTYPQGFHPNITHNIYYGTFVWTKMWVKIVDKCQSLKSPHPADAQFLFLKFRICARAPSRQDQSDTIRQVS